MIKLAIIKNESPKDHQFWVKACQKFNIIHDIYDFRSNDLISSIRKGNYAGVLITPTGTFEHYKQLYDEKLTIINNDLGIPCYPNAKEIRIHENKKLLSFWLDANDIKHPSTWIFYEFSEASNFIKKWNNPLVGKMNIGASGKGVVILNDKSSKEKYIYDAFKGAGLKSKIGPNWKMGRYLERIKRLIKEPDRFVNRLKVYSAERSIKQQNYVIFQEYIPHEYEWRLVRIGGSFFGYRKIKKGDKASGAKGYLFSAIPFQYLDFIKEITDRFNFRSMAIDCFEVDGTLLVNEMQTIFGHVNPFICEVDGQPGRYVYLENSWNFEPGDFNANKSYYLRLEDFLSSLESDDADSIHL